MGTRMLLVFLSCLAWISQCAPKETRNNKSNNKDFNIGIQSLLAMADPKTSIINVKSRMNCISECIRRKGCTYFGSKYASWLGCHQCLLDMNWRYEKSYRTSLNCDRIGEQMSKYPQAIGGPCADHGCNASTVCTPAVVGYTCVKDIRRGQTTRPKKHLSDIPVD